MLPSRSGVLRVLLFGAFCFHAGACWGLTLAQRKFGLC